MAQHSCCIFLHYQAQSFLGVLYSSWLSSTSTAQGELGAVSGWYLLSPGLFSSPVQWRLEHPMPSLTLQPSSPALFLPSGEDTGPPTCDEGRRTWWFCGTHSGSLWPVFLKCFPESNLKTIHWNGLELFENQLFKNCIFSLFALARSKIVACVPRPQKAKNQQARHGVHSQSLSTESAEHNSPMWNIASRCDEEGKLFMPAHFQAVISQAMQQACDALWKI